MHCQLKTPARAGVGEKGGKKSKTPVFGCLAIIVQNEH